MEKVIKILITIFSKTIGAGLATIGLVGAGVGVFIVSIYLFYGKRFLFTFLFLFFGSLY